MGPLRFLLVVALDAAPDVEAVKNDELAAPLAKAERAVAVASADQATEAGRLLRRVRTALVRARLGETLRGIQSVRNDLDGAGHDVPLLIGNGLVNRALGVW